MNQRWAGSVIACLIVVGVAAVLLTNLNLGDHPSRVETKPKSAADKSAGETETVRPSAAPTGFHEVPIGEVVKPESPYHLRIDAVWLPSAEWDGSKVVAGVDVIHLEADVKALERNPHGFAKGAFLPYLKIAYRIVPEAGGATILSGDLLPMVALDGPHYGASVSLPKAGKYHLVLDVQPPSAGGLGRHTDPITGVPAWWKPFQAEIDWDYDPKAGN